MMLFFRRWKQGIKDLTPLQMIKSKLFGLIGQIIGLLLASTYMWFSSLRFFLVFMLFTIFLIGVELINTYKQYQEMNYYG